MFAGKKVTNAKIFHLSKKEIQTARGLECETEYHQAKVEKQEICRSWILLKAIPSFKSSQNSHPCSFALYFLEEPDYPPSPFGSICFCRVLRSSCVEITYSPNGIFYTHPMYLSHPPSNQYSRCLLLLPSRSWSTCGALPLRSYFSAAWYCHKRLATIGRKM